MKKKALDSNKKKIKVLDSVKKHIIFDWNGTLIDDAFVFVDILNILLKESNLLTPDF